MTASTHVVHVLPDSEGGWKVEKDGAGRPSARTETKEDAIFYASELAQATRPSQLIIYDDRGGVELERSFSRI